MPIVGRAEGALRQSGLGSRLLRSGSWGGSGCGLCEGSSPASLTSQQVRLCPVQIGVWRGRESPAPYWTAKHAHCGGALPVTPGWLVHQVFPGEAQTVQCVSCLFWVGVAVEIHRVQGQREGEEDLCLLVPEAKPKGARWEGCHGRLPFRADRRGEMGGGRCPGCRECFPAAGERVVSGSSAAGRGR